MGERPLFLPMKQLAFNLVYAGVAAAILHRQHYNKYNGMVNYAIYTLTVFTIDSILYIMYNKNHLKKSI